MAPTTMKALKSVENKVAEVKEVPVPSLRPDRLLVKVSHVALNPTDWKHIDFMATDGATVGCDFAGVVEEVGSEIEGNWKKGDRVAGVTHGTNTLDVEDGAFAEYAIVKPNGLIHIPNNLSDEDAATIGVAVITTGLTLYQKLRLPMPGSVPANVPILVYGGSSATGTIAIQFAKLSGARVLTTCSPRNFSLVESIGAEKAFNYNDQDVVQQIKEYTKDKLHFVLDCIGGDDAARICAESLSSLGGQLVTIIPGQEYPRDDIRKDMVLAYTAMGEAVRLRGNDIPRIIEESDLCGIYFRLAEKLFAEGKLKVHPPRVGQGLENVLEGLDEMRQGKVSGTKLVYKI